MHSLINFLPVSDDMWIVCQGTVSRTSGALFTCGPSNEWTVHIPECGQSSFCLEVTSVFLT